MNLISDIELSPLSKQILSALPNQIGIIDEEGVLIANNDKWAISAAETPQSWAFPALGENIFNVLQQPLAQKNYYALQLILAYKTVLKGQKETLSIQYQIKNKPETWLSLTISALEDGKRFLLINEDITANIQAKNLVKEHHLRFQKHFENKLYGIIVTDHNLKIVDINQTACNLLGCTLPNIVSTSLTHLINIPLSFNGWNKRNQFDELFLGESILTTIDGRPIPVELNITIYTIPTGEKVINCIFKDISAKKEAETQLLLEQEFMNASLNSLPTAFFVIDEQGLLIRWNQVLVHELEYDVEELRGMPIKMLIHPDDWDRVWPLYRGLDNNTPVNLEVRCLSKNGNELHYLISGRIFNQNNQTYIVGGGVNLGDFKKTESERQLLEKYFSQLFEKAQVGMILFDANGKVIKSNSFFRNLVGYTETEIKDKSFASAIIPTNKLHESIDFFDLLKKNKHVSTDTIRIHKNGTQIPVQLSFIPITINNKAIASFGVYVDLSNQLKNQKIISDQLYEREILIQEIHHRVKNNMAIISGILELESMNSENPTLRKNLQNTQNRIHSISRIHEVMYRNRNLTSINFLDYMQELVKNFRSQNYIEIHFQCHSDIYININQAIPCGMLINEITSQVIHLSELHNTPKFCFEVHVSHLNDQIFINFSHNSPQEILEKSILNKTLSGDLISVLMKQLECETINIKNEQHIELIFTQQHNKKGAHNALL